MKSHNQHLDQRVQIKLPARAKSSQVLKEGTEEGLALEAQLCQQSETSVVSGGRSPPWLFQMYHHKMLLWIRNSKCCTEH